MKHCWFGAVVLACGSLLSACSIGYRVNTDDVVDTEYTLQRAQVVSARTGSQFTDDTLATDIRGVLYKSGDSLLFDGVDESINILLAPKVQPTQDGAIRLQNTSFDVDAIILPVRYRFARGDQPAVLASSANLAVYMGYRQDAYTVNHSHHSTTSSYHIQQVGVGLGFIVGLTPVTVQPDVDVAGVILGVGSLVDLGGVSFGVAAGVDQVIDNQKWQWPYNGGLWIGAWLGLNLN